MVFVVEGKRVLHIRKVNQNEAKVIPEHVEYAKCSYVDFNITH